MPVLSDTTAYLHSESRSEYTFAAATRVLAGGVSRGTMFREPYPPLMAYGCGSPLVDLDGDERIDYLNYYMALIHGLGFPVIVKRIHAEGSEALQALPERRRGGVAGRIVDLLPVAEHDRFTSSVTEAIMLALRLVRAASGGDRPAKFEGRFHGTYDDTRVSVLSPVGLGCISTLMTV